MGGSVVAAIVAGIMLTAVAFAHAVGPALFLVAITPFDAIPFVIFGVAGNAITFVPIVILLVRVHPALWGQVFFGSRIQQYATIVVFTLGHVPWEWWVAVPWVALTNLWFYRRRSLLAIMIVHGVTNAALLLLAILGEGWLHDADGSPISLWFFV